MGITCVVASAGVACEVCASGLCSLCGLAGRWGRESQPGKHLRQRRIVRVFWELRVHVGRRPNVLRTVRACKHCDWLRYGVLNRAARLTLAVMRRRVEDGMSAEESFWRTLVGDREREFGTEWKECPQCGMGHSVWEACPGGSIGCNPSKPQRRITNGV